MLSLANVSIYTLVKDFFMPFFIETIFKDFDLFGNTARDITMIFTLCGTIYGIYAWFHKQKLNHQNKWLQEQLHKVLKQEGVDRQHIDADQKKQRADFYKMINKVDSTVSSMGELIQKINENQNANQETNRRILRRLDRHDERFQENEIRIRKLEQNKK